METYLLVFKKFVNFLVFDPQKSKFVIFQANISRSRLSQTLLKLRLSCLVSFSWSLENQKATTKKKKNSVSIKLRYLTAQVILYSIVQKNFQKNILNF